MNFYQVSYFLIIFTKNYDDKTEFETIKFCISISKTFISYCKFIFKVKQFVSPFIDLTRQIFAFISKIHYAAKMISMQFAIMRTVLSVIVFVSLHNQTNCCSHSYNDSTEDRTIKGKRHSGNYSCKISGRNPI